MALFSRKDKNVEMAKAVAAELAKAGYGINASPGLNGSPMSGSGYNSAYAADQPSAGQGIVTTIGQANPMPRPGLSPQGGFGAMLGPAAPLLPAPIDVVLDESGRAMPRKYEYQTAINLNLTQTEVPFATLKALTEQCDVIHRAIEIRVSDIVKQQWSFAPDASAIAAIMNEQNVTHAKAARIARELYGDEIQRLNAFWENPYVASDRSWTEWITECLWQIFAFDQLCIYPRYNLGKDLMGLDVIDAPTIKILLDNRGDIPHPPLPAYQQVLWGFPRGEFTASPDADGSFYNAPGKYGEFLTDQLAVYVKNRRTWSPYGFSPVEEAIPAASLYLNRQVWLNAEYQNGSTPMTWMRTNSQEMDHLKLAAFERVLNDTLTGSTAERHRVKVLPDGFDPVAMPTMEERWRSDYDEYIIKRISSIFGVSPASLGVVSRAGLGGGKGAAEGDAENVEVVSTRPMENYITDVVNSLCRRFLKADKNVTFVLNDTTSAMEETLRNKGYQTSLFSGFMTLNDVRGEIGEPLYDMPEADEPMIVAGNAVQFLKGMLATGSDGETIGQTDGHLRTVSQSQESTQGSQASSQESAQSQVESGKGSGETNAPKLSPVGSEIPAVGAPAQKTAMADEMRDFAQFVKARTKRGNWRAFDFSTVPEFVAESLNESAYFIAKGARPMPDKLAIWAIEESERLLGDTPKGLVTKRKKKEDLHNHAVIEAARKKHAAAIAAAIGAGIHGWQKAVEQAVASAPTQGADYSALKVIANQAVQHNVTVSSDALQGTFRAVLGDAGEAGFTNAASALKVGPIKTGASFQALLDNIDASASGVQGTTMTRIVDTITQGLNSGLSARDIGTAINGIINDPTRADMIAVTETNTAYNAASIDTYAAAGLAGWEWIAYDGACEICLSLEGFHDITDTDFPSDASHPNCRCTVNGSEQTSGD